MAHILIVDDDEDHGAFVAMALQRLGHDTLVSSNGRACIEQLSHLGPSLVDMVITDIFMPVMDGFELLAEVRQAYPLVRVIGMTGGYRGMTSFYGTSAVQLGAEAVLFKPFSMEELTRTVTQTLNGTNSSGMAVQ